MKKKTREQMLEEVEKYMKKVKKEYLIKIWIMGTFFKDMDDRKVRAFYCGIFDKELDEIEIIKEEG